jgi:hypothetical protein
MSPERLGQEKSNGDGKDQELSLHQTALEDLRRSGLSDDHILASGFSSITDPVKIAAMLGWKHPAKKLGPCLVIPYRNRDGTFNGYRRLRPANPRKNKKDGKPIKYEAPVGLPNHAYFPPGTVATLDNPQTPLLITEGEKKAAKADQEGFPCIGLAGVYAWQKKRPRGSDGKAIGPRELIDDLASIPWQGRPVYIVFDSDAITNPNVRWAEWHLAKVLAAKGAVVKVVRLPQGEPGTDEKPVKVGLDDYLVAHSPDDFQQLCQEAVKPKRPSRSGRENHATASGGGEEDDGKQKLAAATVLVQLAIAAKVELFHSPNMDGYATVPLEGRRETWSLKSKGFRRWLNRLYFQAKDKTAGGQAVQDAIATLEGQALFDGPECHVHVRLAEHGGKIYLDLADPQWQAVEVDAAGWRIVSDPPVKFRRTKGLLPLPVPLTGGSIDELRPFVNVAGDDDWRLLVAWLVQALRPRGPYPVLCHHGEQGSAKSTTARVIRSLTDPSSAPLRCQPRDERDLMIAATNSWTVAFDNLSYLSEWLSDALCRLATGGGFSTRELYTDDEETIFDAMRPCILTSIEDVATRGDLLERAIILCHPQIPDDKRRTEGEFWAAFEMVRPRILGALLDAVSGAMCELPHTGIQFLPRMADFATWVTAAESTLGWEPGSFLKSYTGNQQEANELTLDASPVVAPLRQFAESKGEWEGTAGDLLNELTAIVGEAVAKSKDWPKKPNVFSGKLRRLAPNLRKTGIYIDFDRDKTKQRKRIIRVFVQQEEVDKSSSASSGTVHVAENAVKSGVQSDAPKAVSDDRSDDPVTSKNPVQDGSDDTDDLLHALSDSEVIE